MAYDPLADIEALRQQQKQQAYSNLESAKNNSLGQLNQEKAAIQPKYYKSRNEAGTQSQLQAKNFAEYMANRGLTSSGTAAQAELTRNVGLQGAISDLKTAENQEYGDISRRESDVNNNFNSNVASAYSGIDSDVNQRIIAYKTQLAQEERQREYEKQQAELAYQRQLSLAKARKSSSSSKSSSKKASTTETKKAQAKANIYDAFNSLNGYDQKQQFVNQYADDIKKEEGGQDILDSLALRLMKE